MFNTSNLSSGYRCDNTSNQTITLPVITNATIFHEMNISQLAKDIMLASYIFIFVVGIVGNVEVIYIIGIIDKLEKSCDIQIISLAVADVLSAMFVPIVAIYDIVVNLEEWKLLGSLGCKLFVSIDHMTTLVSVFILVSISMKRLR